MRKLAVFFAVTSAVNIIIGTQGTYRAVRHMETVQFCGQTCHVMKPENTAHLLPFHQAVACANCHVNNNYTTLPTDCYGCHSKDYSGTTDPNHVTAGFPTTCATCHSTSSWLGATFNHTWFNTNHGRANGVCSVCHTNPNDYSIFQCTNCHAKTQTDNEHRGVGGYVYNSVNCYGCHKNGGD